MSTRRDPEREQEAIDFIKSISGVDIEDFHEDLKSGVVLCEFINTLSPGAVKKINKRNMSFMCMENIEAYVNATVSIGIPQEYIFVTIDLWEAKNLAQVALNIIAVKRHFGHGFQTQQGGGETILDIDPLYEPNNVELERAPETEQLTNHMHLSRTGGARRAGQMQITTSQKCPVCTLNITGACLDAIGDTWHPKCFNCRKCGENLARKLYFENDGKAYCDRCILLVNPQTSIRTGTN